MGYKKLVVKCNALRWVANLKQCNMMLSLAAWATTRPKWIGLTASAKHSFDSNNGFLSSAMHSFMVNIQ